MRSPRGFLGSIVFLSLLPVAVVYQMFFDVGIEVVTHGILGAGSILLSFSVFDFKTPRWLLWMGAASTAALGVIFLLQGVSLLIQNEWLDRMVFTVLGQGVEKLLGDLYFVWCIGMLFTDSEGKTRIFGFVVLSFVVGLELYLYTVTMRGGIPEESLKLLYFLLFIWLLFESKKTLRHSKSLQPSNI